MNVQARRSIWQARSIKSRDPRRKRFAVGRFESLEERVLLSTVTWVAKGSGNWNIAANWSTGAVPQAGASVVINKSSSVTVTLPASTSIGSLSLTGAMMNITGGTLTVSGAVSNAGTLEVQPGAHVVIADNESQTAAGTLTLPAAGLTTGVGTNLLTNTGFESPSGTAAAPSAWPSWGTSDVSTQYAHTGANRSRNLGQTPVCCSRSR